jgi:uncharacterized phage protein (TIGR01671 family)
MREIKFRAWDKENKIMLYSSLHDKNWYTTPKNDENGSHCYRGKRQDDKYKLEIMEFTGFQDKKEVDIYEKDFLKCRYMIDYDLFRDIDDIVEVKFENGKFKPMTNTKSTQFRTLSYYYDYEIIGNEYQNSEILEQINICD